MDTADIHWIESVKDYIRVVTKDKTYMTKQKISVAEKLLPMGRFLRIHRSFIIPIDGVEGYNPNYVIIAGKKCPSAVITNKPARIISHREEWLAKRCNPSAVRPPNPASAD